MSSRFNRISIYALNKKDPDAIVYPTADGKTVRVTREDFPSEDAFLAFKAWSDENFHEEENLDHREVRSSHCCSCGRCSYRTSASTSRAMPYELGYGC